jgi:hypothetical protein
MLKKRAQTTEPKLEHHKELPLHICKLPLSQCTLPLNQCSNATRECSKEQKTAHQAQGRLSRLHRAVRPPTVHLTASGRLDCPKRPALHQTAQELSEQIGTPSKHPQVPKACTNFSPLLTMHESRQNAKSFNI